MEPPEIAVEVLGGDAAEAAQEALDLAVAVVGRLDVHRTAHPFASRGVGALVRDIERRRDGRIAAVGVRDGQRIRGEDRLQHLLYADCVESGQGMAEGRAAPRLASTSIGTCSPERPRLRALPPRQRYAALGRLLDRLALGKRGAEGEAALSGGSDSAAATSLRYAAVNSSTRENQSRNRS